MTTQGEVTSLIPEPTTEGEDCQAPGSRGWRASARIGGAAVLLAGLGAVLCVVVYSGVIQEKGHSMTPIGSTLEVTGLASKTTTCPGRTIERQCESFCEKTCSIECAGNPWSSWHTCESHVTCSDQKVTSCSINGMSTGRWDGPGAALDTENGPHDLTSESLIVRCAALYPESGNHFLISDCLHAPDGHFSAHSTETADDYIKRLEAAKSASAVIFPKGENEAYQDYWNRLEAAKEAEVPIFAKSQYETSSQFSRRLDLARGSSTGSSPAAQRNLAEGAAKRYFEGRFRVPYGFWKDIKVTFTGNSGSWTYMGRWGDHTEEITVELDGNKMVLKTNKLEFIGEEKDGKVTGEVREKFRGDWDVGGKFTLEEKAEPGTSTTTTAVPKADAPTASVASAKVVFPFGEAETTSDFDMRLKAATIALAPVYPKSAVEQSSLFTSRLEAAKTASAAIYPMEQHESATEFSARLKAAKIASDPILPKGKDEHYQYYAQRLEAAKTASAPIFPQIADEIHWQFSARLEAAKSSSTSTFAKSESEDDGDFKDRLRASKSAPAIIFPKSSHEDPMDFRLRLDYSELASAPIFPKTSGESSIQFQDRLRAAKAASSPIFAMGSGETNSQFDERIRAADEAPAAIFPAINGESSSDFFERAKVARTAPASIFPPTF